MESTSQTDSPKNEMTEEERLKLCKKLDDDLETFMNGFEKKPFTQAWTEDNWEEEMDKHPFFMKKSPEPGDELHPLLQGLQELKYSSTDNTPEELAMNYKDDGNFNFKHKNYRLAVVLYTKALKINCGVPEVESSLYNNRSAANYFLKNYRSSLRDCEWALKIKPDYDKVMLRAANCCYYTDKYDKSVEYCENLLNKNLYVKEAQVLRQKCVIRKREFLRDLRKKKSKESGKVKLLAELAKRDVKFDWDEPNFDELLPRVPQLQDHMVHLNEEGKLSWPVVFAYPEYQLMDFVQEFCEDDKIIELLQSVFENGCEWDIENAYNTENINAYFENSNINTLFQVDINQTLGEVMQHKGFLVRYGTPTFILLVKSSRTEHNFLQKYHVKLL